MSHLTDAAPSPPAPASPLTITTSRGFVSWLSGTGSSLALTTYQSGKILLVGARPDGTLSVFERTLERPMGLAVEGARLAVATLTQIVTFVDAGPAVTGAGGVPPAAAGAGPASDGRGGEPAGFDAVYIPQVAHFTGDLDAHDLAFDAQGRLVFANTLFGCLARVSDTHSFTALWRPPFLSRLAPEDRCHLNGLAMHQGEPAYVTAVATTDVTDGWREHRTQGGVVLAVPSGEVACAGLSMPHSPRLGPDGRLWVLNSGTGELGWVDLARARFEPVAFLPGFLRGLAFVGRHAVVGLSEPRGQATFAGLPLQARLERERVRPRCGAMVVDLATGDIVHWLRLEGVVSELFDVASLPGRRRPSMIGFRSTEIRRVISVENAVEA